MNEKKKTLNTILIPLNISEIKSLKKCLQETIINNNIVLSKCDFSDEEDIEHWGYINNYNENLKEIQKMIFEFEERTNEDKSKRS